MEYAAMKTDTEEFKQKLQDRLELQKAHQQALEQRAKRLAVRRCHLNFLSILYRSDSDR